MKTVTMKTVTIKKAEAEKYRMANVFLKMLKDDNVNEIASLYFHIFSLMSLESLDGILVDCKTLWRGKDEFYKMTGKTEWFRLFHKTLRQTDVFDGVYRKVNIQTLSKTEKSEWLFLYDKVTKEGYDKSGKDELFNPEYKRYLELSDKKRSGTREKSLGGHIDMILWNLIHVDKDDFLYKTMLQLFQKKIK